MREIGATFKVYKTFKVWTMNRKGFIGSIAALAAGALLPAGAQAAAAGPADEWATRIPPYLKPGDTIALTSPAGPITAEEMAPAIAVIESWSFKVRLGTSIGKKNFNMGGTDDERRADLQQLLDDRTVKAILCARGGYGSVRIVDGLSWTRFLQQPKWLIGFSDITVLHCHIHRHCGVATLHSKMTNSFPSDWSKAEPVQIQTIESIRNALTGKKQQFEPAPHEANRPGKAEGVLVGGNLRIIENLAGTPSDLPTDGRILFLEDTGEYLYSIDRMFWNLKRTGKLAKLKGLVIGGFSVKPDDPGEEFGKTVAEIVMEKVKSYHYPVCFNFPVGHQRANFALKCGARYRMEVQPARVQLTDDL